MPDRNGEMTPEEMFNKMMEEQQKIMTPTSPVPQNPTMPTGQPGSPPILDANQQRILNELQTAPPAPLASTGSHPAQVSGSLPQCPECGMMHPPNTDGKPCGNAPIKGTTSSGVDLHVEVNKFIVILKNIAVSQIQSKDIKDVNKFLQYMTLEMTKLMEGYNE